MVIVKREYLFEDQIVEPWILELLLPVFTVVEPEIWILISFLVSAWINFRVRN